MPSWFQFFIVSCAWALIGAFALKTDFLDPVSLGAVWTIGFVLIAGTMASGWEAAKTLLVYWLGTLAGISAIGGFIFLAIGGFS